MKTSILLRLAAAGAAFCATLALFSVVASLAEPPQPTAGVQLAQARTVLAR